MGVAPSYGTLPLPRHPPLLTGVQVSDRNSDKTVRHYTMHKGKSVHSSCKAAQSVHMRPFAKVSTVFLPDDTARVNTLFTMLLSIHGNDLTGARGGIITVMQQCPAFFGLEQVGHIPATGMTTCLTQTRCVEGVTVGKNTLCARYDFFPCDGCIPLG